MRSRRAMTRLLSPRTDRVLAYVNRLRAQFDQPPLDGLPKGIPCNIWQCPIARALPRGARAGPGRISVLTVEHGVKLFVPPAYVRRWMNDFDNGLIVGLTDVGRTDGS